jgi:hypothetical protein
LKLNIRKDRVPSPSGFGFVSSIRIIVIIEAVWGIIGAWNGVELRIFEPEEGHFQISLTRWDIGIMGLLVGAHFITEKGKGRIGSWRTATLSTTEITV